MTTKATRELSILQVVRREYRTTVVVFDYVLWEITRRPCTAAKGGGFRPSKYNQERLMTDCNPKSYSVVRRHGVNCTGTEFKKCRRLERPTAINMFTARRRGRTYDYNTVLLLRNRFLNLRHFCFQSVCRPDVPDTFISVRFIVVVRTETRFFCWWFNAPCFWFECRERSAAYTGRSVRRTSQQVFAGIGHRNFVNGASWHRVTRNARTDG